MCLRKEAKKRASFRKDRRIVRNLFFISNYIANSNPSYSRVWETILVSFWHITLTYIEANVGRKFVIWIFSIQIAESAHSTYTHVSYWARCLTPLRMYAPIQSHPSTDCPWLNPHSFKRADPIRNFLQWSSDFGWPCACVRVYRCAYLRAHLWGDLSPSQDRGQIFIFCRISKAIFLFVIVANFTWLCKLQSR